mmetsp:Transcript_69362/g.62232  ORF Transcript_69362/g.62232 Transcript_69362/m.62232 type:complete len:183 (+) Transcript_69362:107-655(+)
MGKSDFGKLYKECKAEVGGKITIKISFYSDKFDPNKDFGGVIVYKKGGKCKWKNEKGALKGHSGRSFYVIIMETNQWEPEQSGPGKMHPFVVTHHMEMNKAEQLQSILGGGFAYFEKELKYHSIWLNSGSCCGEQSKHKSDGSKKLSKKEQMLIDHVFTEWKKRGNHIIIDIPDWLDKALLK